MAIFFIFYLLCFWGLADFGICDRYWADLQFVGRAFSNCVVCIIAVEEGIGSGRAKGGVKFIRLLVIS